MRKIGKLSKLGVFAVLASICLCNSPDLVKATSTPIEAMTTEATIQVIGGLSSDSIVNVTLTDGTKLVLNSSNNWTIHQMFIQGTEIADCDGLVEGAISSGNVQITLEQASQKYGEEKKVKYKEVTVNTIIPTIAGGLMIFLCIGGIICVLVSKGKKK